MIWHAGLPNAAPFSIHQWPVHIPCPHPEGCKVVVIEIQRVLRNSDGRKSVRGVLTDVLRHWIQHPPTIRETPTGPAILQRVDGAPIFASIAYAKNAAWLALSVGERVGIDAVAMDPFDGWQDLESLYLRNTHSTSDPEAANQPAFQAFALRWAIFEAQLKCLGLPIAEHMPRLSPRVSAFTRGETAMAVATANL